MPDRVFLLDGYVDEPANFGVPPYISPHARYLAGAAADAGATVSYATIDEHRHVPGVRERLAEADVLVIIAGALVPGVYLRGSPIHGREAHGIASSFPGETMIAGSTAVYGFGRGGGHAPEGKGELPFDYTYVARIHADAMLHDVLTGGGARQRKRTMEEWRRWSVAGAAVVEDHPDHPQPLIAELDTYHGCVRYVNGGCSFCMEPKEGKPQFRPPEDVVAEVRALSEHGVRNFRIGGQACFFCYGTEELGETPTPRPNVAAVRALLKGVRDACPDLSVLHIDNVDPAILAAHPEESAEIARLVVEHCTDGNIAAFGLETADPDVVEANNLNATPEIAWSAIRLLNKMGAARGPTGLPAFLPGLNFLGGLKGETAQTYERNRAFLLELMASGLMVRRINIRKVVWGKVEARVDERRFRSFKRFVRAAIDHPMLARIVPIGTVIRRVYLELHHGNLTFGRQVGTYPLLVGLRYKTDLDRFVDVHVTEHGERSITGIEAPFPVNARGLKALEALPGVGKRRAARLALARPLHGPDDLGRALDDPEVARRLAPLMDFRAAPAQRPLGRTA